MASVLTRPDMKQKELGNLKYAYISAPDGAHPFYSLVVQFECGGYSSQSIMVNDTPRAVAGKLRAMAAGIERCEKEIAAHNCLDSTAQKSMTGVSMKFHDSGTFRVHDPVADVQSHYTGAKISVAKKRAASFRAGYCMGEAAFAKLSAKVLEERADLLKRLASEECNNP